VPNAKRIFFIRHALRAGFTIEAIFNLTKIDLLFLVEIKKIVDFEEELAEVAVAKMTVTLARWFARSSASQVTNEVGRFLAVLKP
jgi:carbamoyl-phosphate synthase large subunit